MRRWLITGATGFVGRRVVRILSAMGDEVHGAARSIPEKRGDFHYHPVDLLDSESVANLVAEVRADHLMLLAWTTEHGRFWADPRNEEWLVASRRLVEAFLECGGQAVVGAGSCAEYLWDGSRCSEDLTPLEPATLYGRSKATLFGQLSECCSRYYARFAWGRIFFAYGSGEPESKLVPSLIRAAANDRPLVLKEPRRRLDFIHADDVASAFVTLAAGSGQGAYNVATGTSVAVETVAREILNEIGGSGAIAIDESEHPGPDVTANAAKLAALGWSPKLDIREGIRETIRAMKET